MATHYHVHYRTQEGHERVGPRRFRSLASAMRESKKFPMCTSMAYGDMIIRFILCLAMTPGLVADTKRIN